MYDNENKLKERWGKQFYFAYISKDQRLYNSLWNTLQQTENSNYPIPEVPGMTEIEFITMMKVIPSTSIQHL